MKFETNIDELFVLTGNMDIYIMPIGIINNKSTLSISDKYKEYKIEPKIE